MISWRLNQQTPPKTNSNDSYLPFLNRQAKGDLSCGLRLLHESKEDGCEVVTAHRQSLRCGKIKMKSFRYGDVDETVKLHLCSGAGK